MQDVGPVFGGRYGQGDPASGVRSVPGQPIVLADADKCECQPDEMAQSGLRVLACLLRDF
jgi:hypothetical protein